MATQFANGKIVTDGLVLCLDAADLNSYPTTGTTWFDLSRSNNGTLTNGPTFSGTGASSSIVFDGVDDYIDLGSLSTLVGKTNVTVDCWFFNDSLPSGFQSIVGQFAGNGWLIHTYKDNPNLSILVLVGGGGSYGGINITPTNTWYNVMLSYDGTLTGDQNRLKMYVNGVLRTFDSYVGGEVPSTWPDATAVNATIGTLLGYGRYFNGKIPIVRIYEKTLSASEVRQNYNAQKARFGIS
jgi:hypothetical protein